ncbi:MAG: class I SAM-dependent methyltransferase [Saprospiraceae bacterium]|nr:class I SAM-dependent methyltransferase [Saprospiraceae bacterium]
MDSSINVFEKTHWNTTNGFQNHSSVYESEILAIQQAIPQNKKGIEIGVGTGRFAERLNIKFGVEPSENMAKVSEQKGIIVYRAYAESLPLDNTTFDFVLMVTTVCFLSDISKAFSSLSHFETKRRNHFESLTKRVNG